jgi:hypothetical protein
LHLPKTGGTSTSSLFRSLSMPNIEIDDDKDDTKHDSLSLRFTHAVFNTFTDRHKFITSRRLADWLLSDWHHKTLIMKIDLPFKPVRCGLFYSLRLGGVWIAADYWLRYFKVDKSFNVIRLENLEEDANRMIHPLLPKDTPNLSFPHCNSNTYSDQLETFFGTQDLKSIYMNNPLWRQWEIDTYGSTTDLSLYQRLRRAGRFF